MHGPKGVGVLYIARERQGELEPLIYGGGQQHGLRSGTVPVALCVGMAAAADLCGAAEMQGKREALRLRRDAFVEKLHRLNYPVALNGPVGGARHPGNANISFAGFDAQDILGALQPRLAAATGAACTSGIPEPSHVLRAMGMDAAQAASSIRFSLGFGTTDEDIDEAAGLIAEALHNLAPTQGQIEGGGRAAYS